MALSIRNRTGFLDLPAELRNKVYNLALVKSRTIFIKDAKGKRRRPALLYTCRLIQAEASPIFYSTNSFQANSVASAALFLRGLNDQLLPLLRSLRATVLEQASQEQEDGPYGQGAQWWLNFVKAKLKHLNVTCGRSKVNPGVIVMPLMVPDDEEVLWVSSADAEEFIFRPVHRCELAPYGMLTRIQDQTEWGVGCIWCALVE
ncbi:hypothetical protein HII31_01921 [Pseudocercospora fuligena]|uniref:2EXR domain-containing protein n=1 Tax=Pseudocercospora fuligena TaxID=685502 RepID=A0A8H6RUQ1_9PEZI|nr:hypothetical protein HII31_01921 [Pseudocercospora fuligena]